MIVVAFADEESPVLRGPEGRDVQMQHRSELGRAWDDAGLADIALFELAVVPVVAGVRPFAAGVWCGLFEMHVRPSLRWVGPGVAWPARWPPLAADRRCRDGRVGDSPTASAEGWLCSPQPVGRRQVPDLTCIRSPWGPNSASISMGWSPRLAMTCGVWVSNSTTSPGLRSSTRWSRTRCNRPDRT